MGDCVDSISTLLNDREACADFSDNCFRLSVGLGLTNLPQSLPIQRPDLTVRPINDRNAQHLFQAFFLCLSYRVAAAVRGIPSGMPGSLITGRSIRVQLPPSSFDRERW